LSILRGRLGGRRPPSQISQRPFDYDDGHLRRLVRLDSEAKASAADLADYALDMRYEEVQKDLLLWVLPFCLRAWREDLRGEDASYGGVVEQLYPALVDSGVLDQTLTADQAAAVAAFMRDGLLSEIDSQVGLAFSGMNARPYRWVRALATYGVLHADIENLWEAWWRVDTRGRAVAVIQFVSCLAYGEHDNPVFAPWTREEGGGPPCLWEFAGHLYTHRWRDPNVEFLRRALEPAHVRKILGTAVRVLASEEGGERAREIMAGVESRESTLVQRCRELPRILAETREPGVLPSWSS
jgi:hypothetical protein